MKKRYQKSKRSFSIFFAQKVLTFRYIQMKGNVYGEKRRSVVTPSSGVLFVQRKQNKDNQQTHKPAANTHTTTTQQVQVATVCRKIPSLPQQKSRLSSRIGVVIPSTWLCADESEATAARDWTTQPYSR